MNLCKKASFFLEEAFFWVKAEIIEAEVFRSKIRD
jgi:hypothetical protein